jgi:hypothetical protein
VHSFFCLSLSTSLIFSTATPYASSKHTPGFLTAIGVQIGPVTATRLAIFILCVSILQRLRFVAKTFFHLFFRHLIKPNSTTRMRAIRACTALASCASMMQLCVAQEVSPLAVLELFSICVRLPIIDGLRVAHL